MGGPNGGKGQDDSNRGVADRMINDRALGQETDVRKVSPRSSASESQLLKFTTTSEFWASKTGTAADDWCYPFKTNRSSQNNFGDKRKDNRAHAGVDLQYEQNLKIGSLGDTVLAMTNGIVIYMGKFHINETKERAGYILDEVIVLNDDTTVIRYAEISQSPTIKKGWPVFRGQEIGKIKTNSLPEYSRMLHLEVYFNHDQSGKQLETKNANDLNKKKNNIYWYVKLPNSGFIYKRREDLIDPSLVTQLHLIKDFK